MNPTTMTLGTARNLLVNMFTHNRTQAGLLLSSPGIGKTSICYAIADAVGLPRDRVLLFRPSLRDPVDLMGTPNPDGTVTRWLPPEEFYRFRQGSGPGMIIWDELLQGEDQMQNAIAGCMLDNVLGDLRIDDQVLQVATANRVEDKAGANRMVTQLGNRVWQGTVTTNIKEWSEWALGACIHNTVRAFLRFQPDALNDFNPNRPINATPRSWELTSDNMFPNIAGDELRYMASGLVGPTHGMDFAAFAELGMSIDIDELLDDPQCAALPSQPGAQFLVVGALAGRAAEDTKLFEACRILAGRYSAEFDSMLVRDTIARNPAVVESKAYADWAINNGQNLI